VTAFLDLQLTLDECFAASKTVAARWTGRGMHKGTFVGVAPTEQGATIIGITLFRLVGDKIAECWTQWDSSGLLQHLGSVTATQPSAGA
jgi:predicted ester cyclase